MANKKDPPNWLRRLLGGIGKDYKGDVGKQGPLGAIIGTAGGTAVGTGMGFQSRQKKKKAFMKKYYPDKAYDKKKVVNKNTGLTMGDKFKQFRKGTDEMKGGGAAWTRNSRKHGG